MRRSGFTVLELLVASLLLSMLVTVLTMIFNQSSIAWRTGTAGVVELNRVRASLGSYHDKEDDSLPGLGETAQQAGPGGNNDNRNVKYRTVSIFMNWDGTGKIDPNKIERADSSCKGRLYDNMLNEQVDDGVTQLPFDILKARTGRREPLVGGTSGSEHAFAVGVRSAGPDRKWDTDDDISTFPEEVE